VQNMCIHILQIRNHIYCIWG